MPRKKHTSWLESIPFTMTKWVGSPSSLVFHTIVFLAAFGLIGVGYDVERVLLVLTTAVSLEAIYLSLFIQMSVNKQHYKIKGIEADIDEILEDTEELTEDPEVEMAG